MRRLVAVAAELYCPGMERQYGVLWLARVATLIAVVSVAACSPLASKGTMPPPVQQGPSAAPPSGASALLTLYVRSTARQPAWFAVLAGGTLTGGQGYSGGIGVGCVDIGASGQLVLLDRAPQDAGARIVRSIYTRGQVGDLPTLWVDVGADGTVSQGAGVPNWWPGDPQAC